MASKITAVYARVSTDEQAASGLGLADQETRARAYAAALGLAGDVELFVDAGCSGGSLSRPALDRLRARCARREVAHVVVLKLDRLTRSLRDLLLVVDELEARGASLHSVCERIDTGSSAGRMMLAMLGAVAEWERDAIADRTRAAIRAKRAAGKAHGFARLGERSIAGRLEAVDDELATVARIVELRAAGASLRAIADTLTREGRPTKRSGAWRACTVAKVLERAA
jgi:DNA invertase Pin-like site-specific DNA recombinase